MSELVFGIAVRKAALITKTSAGTLDAVLASDKVTGPPGTDPRNKSKASNFSVESNWRSGVQVLIKLVTVKRNQRDVH